MAEDMATGQPFRIVEEVLADGALELVVQVLVLLACQADWTSHHSFPSCGSWTLTLSDFEHILLVLRLC